jgi:hypothetical protein
MIASMSRSRYMLIELADPAATAPPARVARISHGEGSPLAARSIAGTVVIRSSSTIRGFVNR